MKRFFTEFREFAVKGSVVELAVGVVIGAAFNSIVISFVNDILMPPIGLALGGSDFSELFIVLGSGEFDTLARAQAAGAVTINYGVFINAIISFLITACAVYMLVKVVNRLRRERAEEPETTTATRACPACVSEIPKKASRCPFCTINLDTVAE